MSELSLEGKIEVSCILITAALAKMGDDEFETRLLLRYQGYVLGWHIKHAPMYTTLVGPIKEWSVERQQIVQQAKWLIALLFTPDIAPMITKATTDRLLEMLTYN